MNVSHFARFAATLAALILLVTFSGCSRASKHARHAARGDSYVQEQQFAKAEIEYLNALRLAPTDFALMKKLGRVYYEQGRNATALGTLGRVKAKHPEDTDTRALIAELLVRINGYAAAREEALFVCTNQPTNSTTLLILAETSIGTTQFLEASRVLDQAAKTAPGPGIQIALASFRAREGKLGVAEDHLKEAMRLNAPAPELDLALAKLRFAQTNIVEGEALLKRAADASPVRSFRRLQWIDFQMTRGEIASTKQSLEKMKDEAPDYVPPLIRLAGIALVENRMDDCDQLTKTALRLDAGSYEASLLRARMWTVQRKFASAIDELIRLDSLFVNNAAIKFELAAAYVRAGEHAKALTTVNESLKLDPRMPSAALLQSELNLRTGAVEAAIITLQELHKTRPELREAAALLATAYLARNRFDDAIKIYRESTIRYPKDPDPWTALGIALLRQKEDLDGARSAFEQSLKISPRFVAAAEQLVNLDVNAKNFPAALTRATNLRNATTNSAAGYILEARVHTAANDIKAAEAALLAGLAREPRSMTVYALLADLYAKAGDHAKAIEKLDVMTGQSTNAFGAWTMKGLILESKGELDKARSCYEKALSINKNMPLALNNLAVLLARDPKRMAEAQDLATRAVQNAPDAPEIADTLGWIMYQRGDFAGARRVFAEIADKSKHPEIQYHVGMTAYAVGDAQAAELALTQVTNNPALQQAFRKEAADRLALLALNVRTATPADIQRLEAAIAVNDGDYLAHFSLGTIHQLKGDRDKATAHFKAASKANPLSGQPLLALARLNSGTDDKAALEYARAARKLAPNDPVIASTLGALSVRTGDYVSGYNILIEAQRAGALTSPAEQYQFAIAQIAAGRTADALATLNTLGANAPANLQQPIRETVILLSGDAAQKAPIVEARLKANPNDLVALIASADLQADARKAADLFQKILSLAPNYTPAHQRLAALFIDSLKDEKNAYSHAMRAREAAPNDPQVARVLGKIALERKNYPDALRFAEEASRGLNNDGEPYYLIGAANLSLKRTNEAKIALNKANTLPLKPETAAATKRLLSEIK